MEPLHRPSTLDEPARHVVEQLRMRGRVAGSTEVVGRSYDASAEVVLPYPIHHHARKERMTCAGDPLGDLSASASAARNVVIAFDQLEETARDFLAEILMIAAKVNLDVVRLVVG